MTFKEKSLSYRKYIASILYDRDTHPQSPPREPPKAFPARAAGTRPHGPSSSIEEAEFLRKVGQQVRDARARHGMTRRMLAHDSGLSERYLALLEDGRGNLSMVLLRRVAAAIDVPLARLVLEDEPTVEAQLIAERLGHLDDAELAEASVLRVAEDHPL